MRKSIIRRYLFLSIGVGVIMGVIFPLFANIFTTYRNDYYVIPFCILCILAGVLVGGISFFIGKITLISAIQEFKNSFSLISNGDLTRRMNIDSAVKTMESNLDKVNTQISSITKGVSSLDKIVDNVKSNEENILTLYAICQELQDMSKLINDDIVFVHDIINDSAKHAERIAGSSSNQNKSLDTIADDSAKLYTLSKKLNNQINNFKFND